MKTICVIGLWHLGIVNTIGFAKKGYKVTGIEFDEKKAASLKAGIPPIYEPGVEENLKKLLRTKKIFFTSDPKSVADADFVIIAYDCTVNKQDEVDISPVILSAEKIASYIPPKTPLIITSQIPVGTSGMIGRLIKKINPHWSMGVVYTPENLRLGTALERFLCPEQIVLGSDHKESLTAVSNLYGKFNSKLFFTDVRSAEMVKHALNAYLSCAISFGNEIAILSQKLGVDGFLVLQALKGDKRVGSAPVLPGLGFSGGTLARDMKQLLKFAKLKNVDTPLLKSIMDVNENTYTWVIQTINDKLEGQKKKTAGFLGLTYKAGTSTLRSSPAVKIMQKLKKFKITCFGFDPKADKKDLRSYSRIFQSVGSEIELAQKSDILILVTEWPQFRLLNFKVLAKQMKKPIIIDCKNFLDPHKLRKAGFMYEGFGRKL